MKGNINLNVPSKLFFSLNDLWWNGIDGFKDSDSDVFIDPSTCKGGSNSLFAKSDYLLNCLNIKGFKLIWTMLGCKQVKDKNHYTIDEITFSQLAKLDKDNEIEYSDIYRFKDFSQDTGFNIEK